MEDISLIYLAIFDFVPNIAFLIGAYFLVLTAYTVRGKNCGILVVVGALLILIGGFMQATWKLLYTTGTADIRLMSNVQFVLLAPGFVVLLIAVIMVAWRSKKRTDPPLLAIASWKLPFLIVMVIASLIAQGMLAYISFRRHAYAAGVGFVVAFVCLLSMGGLAGSEQTITQQWTEEIVNSIAQIAFATGSYLLYRDFKAHAC
jgi:hypothetical protein